MTKNTRLTLIALVLLLILAALVAWQVTGAPRPRANAVALLHCACAPVCAPGGGERPVLPLPSTDRRDHKVAEPGVAAGGKPEAGTAEKADAPEPDNKAETKTDLPAPIVLASDVKAGDPVVRFKVKFRVIGEDKFPVSQAEVWVSGFAVAYLEYVEGGPIGKPALESFYATSMGKTDHMGELEVEIGLRADFDEFAYASLEAVAAKELARSAPTEFEWGRGSGAPKEPVVITLPRRGGLRGRVVDGAGVGVPTVAVRVFRPDAKDPSKQEAYVFTDVTGNFEFANLAPGEVHLRAKGDFFQGVKEFIPATVYPDVVTGLDAEIVVEALTRYVLKVLPPEGMKRPYTLAAVYFAGDRELERKEIVWFNDNSVRLYGPPEGATSVELSRKEFLPLRIDLPGLKRTEVKELGEYRLVAVVTTPPPED